MSRRALAALAVAGVVPLACSLPRGAAPTSPSLPPSAPTPSPKPTVELIPTTPAMPTVTSLPAVSGPCQAMATRGFGVYTRPSLLADIFGTFSTDLPAETIASRTTDGWLGFDPGVAQAANIGVFRLRWIPPGAPIDLSGDCASVPVATWAPAPGVCYQMSMGPVEVHAAADPASTVSHTLVIEEFAAITGRTGTGWLFVDGNDGTVPGVIGFIPELAMNANGPCDSIPVLSP